MCEDVRSDVMTMQARTPSGDTPLPFTCQERIALMQLRSRYQQGQDLWNTRELAYLRFLLWLCRTGRIEL